VDEGPESSGAPEGVKKRKYRSGDKIVIITVTRKQSRMEYGHIWWYRVVELSMRAGSGWDFYKLSLCDFTSGAVQCFDRPLCMSRQDGCKMWKGDFIIAASRRGSCSMGRRSRRGKGHAVKK
jgi:hypothetical protein